MGNKDFHEKAFDPGTLSKLHIFELYAQEWIPVFVSRAEPTFKEIHIFDFFCGPGKDSANTPGSPLRILSQLKGFYEQGMAGWSKVRIVVHFFDGSEKKVEQLKATILSENLNLAGVEVDWRALSFHDALGAYSHLLSDRGIAKLLIIDQYGVDEVTDDVFRRLISFPRTDFIFFLSSSTLHRFRNHLAIKQKIEKPEDSYDVHRAALAYYRKLIPPADEMFLSPFSIKKRSNIYGLVFGSRHLLGIHKFLQVAWKADEIAGEANFDIDRESIQHGEALLPFDIMVPNKIRAFEEDLETHLKAGNIRSEADLIRFCIEAGMTCQHSTPILKKLKEQGIIGLNFRTPDVGNIKAPRPISLIR